MLKKNINFCSDNITGISPEILAAIVAASQGAALPYGEDESTRRLNRQFSELFETSVVVFPVATGTAANALALSTITPPYGAIYCHAESHVNLDECGAPEFYTGGAKLVSLSGEKGKINPAKLAEVLTKSGTGIVHRVQPATVSITQATEAGTVYTPDQIAAIAEVTHQHQLYLHVDGARFANAVVSLGCSPADLTWRAGVDVLCFGGTKNGAMAAEAVIFFNSALATTFAYRRKRSGHLFSKMRFLSAQLEAYITNNLWLKNAAHANQMAGKLAQGLAALPWVRFRYPVEANELFIELPSTLIEALLAEGFLFYRWEGEHSTIVRLVTAFNTPESDVMALLGSLTDARQLFSYH